MSNPLLNCFPVRYLDLTALKQIGEARTGCWCTIKAKVLKASVCKSKNENTYKQFTVCDDTGVLLIQFFEPFLNYVDFEEGEEVVACGLLTEFDSLKAFYNPLISAIPNDCDSLEVLPVYATEIKPTTEYFEALENDSSLDNLLLGSTDITLKRCLLAIHGRSTKEDLARCRKALKLHEAIEIWLACFMKKSSLTHQLLVRKALLSAGGRAFVYAVDAFEECSNIESFACSDDDDNLLAGGPDDLEKLQGYQGADDQSVSRAPETKIVLEDDLGDVLDEIRDLPVDCGDVWFVSPFCGMNSDARDKMAYGYPSFNRVSERMQHPKISVEAALPQDFNSEGVKGRFFFLNDVLANQTEAKIHVVPALPGNVTLNCELLVIEDASRFSTLEIDAMRKRAQAKTYVVSKSKSKIQLERLKFLEAHFSQLDILKNELSLRRDGDILGCTNPVFENAKLLNVVRDREIIKEAKGLALDIFKAEGSC